MLCSGERFFASFPVAVPCLARLLFSLYFAERLKMGSPQIVRNFLNKLVFMDAIGIIKLNSCVLVVTIKENVYEI